MAHRSYIPKRKNLIKTPQFIILGLLFIGILLGVGMLLFASSNNIPVSSTNTGENSRPERTIDMSPATDADKKASEDHKASLPDNNTAQPPSTSATKKSVVPIITTATSNSSDSYEVVGFVPEIAESGGLCTAIVSKDGTSLNRSSTGFVNSNYTQCPPITFAANEFPAKGEWQVALTYSSDTSEGSATNKMVLQVN